MRLTKSLIGAICNPPSLSLANSLFSCLRPKMKKVEWGQSAFKLPSPCKRVGSSACFKFEEAATNMSFNGSVRNTNLSTAEQLNRRPDLENLLLDALELSVDDVLRDERQKHSSRAA